jgi:outer membrane protein assembly factor BamB
LAVGVHIDPAHAGRATVASGHPMFPSASAWVTTLNNNVSYPVIADGKVFVLTDGVLTAGTGRSLYALDETTGNVVWGPVSLPFGSFTYAAHAYDHGRVFVIDYDTRLSAYDAATGAEVWSETLQESGAFNAAPTAINGFVYVGGLGTLYAIDGQTGAIVWKATPPDGGTVSTPTVSADGLFVTAPCHAYKFDPLTGNMLWQSLGSASGGGRGNPSVLANNKLYDRHDGCPDRGRILDAGTGALLGGLDTDTVPAFSEDAGFFLANGTLRSIALASGGTLWSFTGDGHLTSAPIVVNDVVVIASTSGKVFALNANTGNVAWSATAPSQISYSEYDGVPTVLGGNAVGDGYLLVPAGNSLTAWRLLP